MQPIINVEFTARIGDHEFKEESVAFHSAAELFDYVGHGGGCERIPDDVEEVQMIFLSPTQTNHKNPIMDIPATLEMGIVFFTGPLADILQTTQQLIGKASRRELSDCFLKILGVKDQ